MENRILVIEDQLIRARDGNLKKKYKSTDNNDNDNFNNDYFNNDNFGNDFCFDN